MLSHAEALGVSDRVAARIVSGAYVDDGTVTSNNLDRIVDRNLIRSQRAKFRKQHKIVTSIQSLYFDGKQNPTK